MISKVGKEDRAMYQCVVSARHENVQAAAHLALGGERERERERLGKAYNFFSPAFAASSSSSSFSSSFSYYSTSFFSFSPITTIKKVKQQSSQLPHTNHISPPPPPRPPPSWPSSDSSPELHYRFQEQTLQPGPSVSLKCVATGNPPPQFIWTLDGFPLPENER